MTIAEKNWPVNIWLIITLKWFSGILRTPVHQMLKYSLRFNE